MVALHTAIAIVLVVFLIIKIKADSTGRRNTLTMEVFKDGDERLEKEDQRCAGGASSAVAC